MKIKHYRKPSTYKQGKWKFEHMQHQHTVFDSDFKNVTKRFHLWVELTFAVKIQFEAKSLGISLISALCKIWNRWNLQFFAPFH